MIILKKFIKISIPVIIIAIILYGIYYCCFDIQQIKGHELINEVTSPSGKYTILAYLNNYGATVDFAVLCAVKNNETQKEKNIYWNYHCNKAEIEWNSEDIVTINGVKLNIHKDTYDFRND